MKQYTTAFKARVLQRLVGPRAISAYRVASEVGVSQVTLSRWLAAARSVPDMTAPAKKWTGAISCFMWAQDWYQKQRGPVRRWLCLEPPEMENTNVGTEALLRLEPSVLFESVVRERAERHALSRSTG